MNERIIHANEHKLTVYIDDDGSVVYASVHDTGTQFTDGLAVMPNYCTVCRWQRPIESALGRAPCIHKHALKLAEQQLHQEDGDAEDEAQWLDYLAERKLAIGLA
uniref:Uncharacterized protein n=1 Tax=viral metagenome TaxID=1070528 RepID=A0A6M3J6Y3_9ZZZZ